MAAKHHRDEIDWSFLLKKVAEMGPKKLIETGNAKLIVDMIGLDGILAALTPEQRRELAERVERENA